ncbi:hypothetical protein AJ79_09750 [Helicocarpus griseus UAMH5409]|uniref:Endopolyphosphatase n=1 Tax=Helicocarpus griseus UAMH5409 TaxID=1447875 RepID=A0A2B7WHJ5_9EURO|nr:hypothetical protein AJ79_09750 [Helicocarpus griseus UAMH5409]
MAKFFLAISLLAIWSPWPFAGAEYPRARKSGELRGEQEPKLHGRFLHITDIHPDAYYKPNTNTDANRNCHRGSGEAGWFGTPGSDCDSPLTLVNATLDWIRDNLADSVDFVVWTGDSARHDNDEKIPRTEKEILDMNQLLANQLRDVFSKSDGNKKGIRVPIVPTIGNNDIMPHNIFKDGPNRWTKEFASIWKHFIPEEQRHSFVQGGWFYVEVIPDKLSVFSLNTMYFFDSNGAVDGCRDNDQPGYEHMEWLRIQLQFIREKNMKAILIGHVPPARAGSKENWDESCWQKYTLWLQQYRDVIAGSMFGHMNIDHFMLQDTDDLKIGNQEVEPLHKLAKRYNLEDEVSAQSRLTYLSSLRDDWSRLPSPPTTSFSSYPHGDEDSHLYDLGLSSNLESKGKKKEMRKYLKKIGGPWAERYSVSLVSPSVIPNYYPTLRVIEYNITGLENAMLWSEMFTKDDRSSLQSSPIPEDLGLGNLDNQDLSGEKKKRKRKKKKKKKHKKHKKSKFIVPDPPSSTAPPGPAYSNQPLTFLSYTQYFSNLTELDTEEAAVSTTHHFVDQKPLSWREYRKKTLGDNQPRNISFEVFYDTKTDKTYKLKDLTVNSLLGLARRIAGKKAGKQDRSSMLPTADAGRRHNETGTSAGAPLKSRKDQLGSSHKGVESPPSVTKSRDKVWNVFLRRAFVGYLDGDDLTDISA